MQVLCGDAAWGEGVVDNEVADETLTVVATPRNRGVRIVGEGGDAGVCGKRHAHV